MAKPTIIIVSELTDTHQAIAYWQKRHQTETITLLPTSIASINLLQQYQIPFTLLDQVIESTVQLEKLTPLPFRLSQYLTQQLKLTRAGINLTQLFTNIFQFKLYLLLSQYISLQTINRQLTPKKILISPSAFSPWIVNLLCQQNRPSVHFLKDNPSKSQSILTPLHHLDLALRYLKLFLAYPPLFPRINPLKLKPAQGKQRILFFSGGLHILSYAAVMHQIKQSPNIDLRIITDKPSLLDKFYLSQANLKANFLPEKLNSQENILCRRLQVKLREKFKTQLKLKDLPSTKLLPKTHLLTIVNHVLQEIADQDLSSVIVKYLKARSIIAHYHPHLVITTHDPAPSALAFTLSAKASQIHTLVLLHGLPSADDHFFVSDQEIVWGEKMKTWLVNQQVPRARLRTGGYPIYYQYRQFFKHHPKSPQPRPVIGIITSGHGHYEWYQALFFYNLFHQLAKIDLPLKLLIRTHPMQNISQLQILAKSYNLDLDINRQMLLEEFIASTDIVITQNSTAAFVPLIAHKPTIFINPWHPLMPEGPLKSTSALLYPQTWDELPQLITSLLRQHHPDHVYRHYQQQLLTDFCGPIDAKIGSRITKHILARLKHK